MYISDEVKAEIRERCKPAEAISFYTGQANCNRHTYDRSRGLFFCPFHDDRRHPSMSAKGDIWQCFTCGEKGDVFTFVQKLFGIRFDEAASRIADDFGVEILNQNVATETEKPNELTTDMAESIRKESDRLNRLQYKEYLSSEIDKLTICHRVLMQKGAEDWILRQYAEEIDNLVEYRSRL